MIKKDPLSYLKTIFILVLALLIIVLTAFILMNNVDYIEVSGEIKPLEYQIVTPVLSGVIKKCVFRDGDIVKYGDVVLEMDSREYKLQLASLISKKELILLKIKALKESIALFLEEKSLFSNKTKRDFQELDIKRQNEIISESEYNNEVYKLKSEELAKNEKFLKLKNDLEQSCKELNSILAEIESLRDKIDKCKIVSRIDGIIIDEDSRIKEGVYYNSGEVVQKIFANSAIYAEVAIPEKKVIKVEINQKVRLFVDAVPYTKYRTFDGRLISLKEAKSPYLTNSFMGEVLIEDPFFKIKSINDIKTKKLFFGLKLRARIYTGRSSILDYFLKK